MDKDVIYTYIYIGILLSRKKNEIMPFAGTWIDMGGYYTEWNKSDRERQILYDVTYMLNLKSTTN